MPLFLPSPSHGVLYLGPIPIRGYAMSILVGIVVAIVIARRRWIKWGGNPTQFENIGLISIIIGIIGARLYWVIIEWQRYFGPGGTWYRVFYIWEGGLGIWGAIIFGFLSGWLMCRRYKIPFLRLADCIAPAFLLAQGIGRLGNWWNQELYGLPTTLPWGLEIDLAHRVAGYEQYATFHPTFLYEMIWDVAGFFFLLWAEKKFKLGRGKLFAAYIVTYATGRFLIELLRIDPVESFWGLRVNSWATLACWIAGVILLIWLVKNRPGPNEPIAPDEQPGGAGAGTADSAEAGTHTADGADTADSADTVDSVEAADSMAPNRTEADSVQENQPEESSPNEKQ